MRGKVEIFLRRHKTYVENEGAVCAMVPRGRAFDIRKFLEEYIVRMGLARKQRLFP